MPDERPDELLVLLREMVADGERFQAWVRDDLIPSLEAIFERVTGAPFPETRA